METSTELEVVVNEEHNELWLWKVCLKFPKAISERSKMAKRGDGADLLLGRMGLATRWVDFW